MDDMWSVLISILVAFGLGAGVWFWMLRGFLPQWLKAKRTGGILVELVRKDGLNSKFVVAVPDAKNVGEYTYELDGVSHVMSPINVRRVLRVRYAQLLEGDTSPLTPHKVFYDYKRDSKGAALLDENGEPTMVARAFEHHDDSSTLKTYLLRAATKPKIPMGMKLNLKVLLPVLIGLGILVFMLMSAGGGGNPVI